MPWAGENEIQLSLNNPYDTAVKNNSGLILPAYSRKVRLKTTTGYAGDMAISDYTYESHEWRVLTMSRERVRYGPTRQECVNSEWWKTGYYDPATGVFHRNGEAYAVEWTGESYKGYLGHEYVRVTKMWTDRWEEAYWDALPSTQTINGSQLAQTVFNSQNGWCDRIDLYFTSIDTQGPVYVHLCETKDGLPNKRRCIATTTLQPEELVRYPKETAVYITPTYLQAGERYAIVITTGGNHRVAVVSGTEYTQGTLFYSLDGVYQQGDFTKDLMLRMHYAQFANPRTVVEFAPITLSDGIADLDLLADTVRPPATDLIYQYQHNGVWYSLEPDTADNRIGLPAMLRFRAVFIGSTDVMPGLQLQGSVFRASRPATSFKHVSTTRTLAAATQNIDVQVLLENWDDVAHTCTVKLRVSGTEEAAAVVEDETRPTGILRTASFSLVAPTAAFEVIIEGATTDVFNQFHVSHRTDIAL